MKKSVLALVGIIALSASSLGALAQTPINPNGVSGSNPRPQGVSGSNPRPQRIIAEVLAFFGL